MERLVPLVPVVRVVPISFSIGKLSESSMATGTTRTNLKVKREIGSYFTTQIFKITRILLFK